MTPKVSIIMGIYNCEDTLGEAIESIFSQSYEDWELIMCDDGSSDGTYEIAKLYQNKHPQKICLLRNDYNKRLAATLNYCATHANGSYLARMDGDDISMPTRLEEQVNFLDEHSEFDIVGTYMQAFDENGDRNLIPVKRVPTKTDLAKITPFNHATIMIRKNVFDSLGGYRVSKFTNRAEDVDLWFRFYASNHRGYNLLKPLYKVRENHATFCRRSWKSSWEASCVLKRGIQMLGLPWYYIFFSCKPLLSQLTPRVLKLYFRKILDNDNKK